MVDLPDTAVRATEIAGKEAPPPAALRPTTKFRDQDGRIISIPGDLGEDQQRQLLRMLSAPNVLPSRPVVEDNTPQEIAREKRISAAEEELGAPLERGEFGVQIKEFEDSAIRFDLARSNKISEKLRKLRDAYPDFEIRTFQEGEDTQIALRRRGDEEFTVLDSEDLITFSDIAEIGGLVISPEILTSIAAAIATRGAGLMARTFSQVVAGFTGRGLDIGIEQLRGFQDDPLRELFTEGSISAAGGGLGELAFAPFRRGIRGVAGRGVLELTPEERAASATAAEANVRGLTPGQVSPLARTMEQQAAATSKRVQEQRLGQMTDALDDITRIRDDFGDMESLGEAELAELVQRIEADIFSIVTNRAATLEQGGRAIKKGRREFVRVWKTFVGRRYDKALEAGEGASFDLTAVQTLARDIKKGVQARGKKIAETVESSILDEFGRPITTVLTKQEAVQLRKLNEGVLGAIDRILKLDPNVEAFRGNTAFVQMKELRTAFFDLKNATIQGTEDINNRFAGQLWGALTDAINRPSGGGADFTRFLRKANLANTRFERLLEVQDLKRIASETQPDRLVNTLIKPGNGFILRTLKRIVPDDYYTRFVDSYKTRLLSTPETIEATLNAWRVDRVGLRSIMSSQEEILFRRIGREMKALSEGPVNKLLIRDAKIMAQGQNTAVRLINASDPQTLSTLILKSGGKESRQAKSLQSGLIQKLLDSSTVVEGGRDVLDARKFTAALADLNKRGLLDAVLTKAQAEMLRSRDLMLSFFRQVANPGASIQAAEIGADIASGLTIPVQPRKGAQRLIRGITGAMRNALIGRMFTTQAGRAFFTGIGRLAGGKIQPDLTTLRFLSVMGTQTIVRLNAQASLEGFRTSDAAP